MRLSTSLDLTAEFDSSSLLGCGELQQVRHKGFEIETIVQLPNYVGIMFATQNYRRFVPAFTICGEYLRCSVFYHDSLIGGDEFSINQNPQLFS